LHSLIACLQSVSYSPDGLYLARGCRESSMKIRSVAQLEKRREEKIGEMIEESDYQIANRRGEVVGRIKRDEINTSSIHQKESLTAIFSVKDRSRAEGYRGQSLSSL
jgi:hypothetical protein